MFDRAADGTLTQKAGAAGCISNAGTGTGSQTCATGVALDGAGSVAISPDGTSVYVASSESDAVDVFDRDPSTGALTQKPLTAGCISNTGTGGLCTPGRPALQSVTGVTVSPDGKNVYATSFLHGAVLMFDRAANGTLTSAGCIAFLGGDGTCSTGNSALQGAFAVAVSPDGTSVYVSSYFGNGVAVFDRAPDGLLTGKAGLAGCITNDGSSGDCTTGAALESPVSVTVSPDGKSVYTASYFSGAVDIFDRAADGTLSQKAGTAGCISQDGTSGQCVASSFALQGAWGVTVSPDGKNVNLATRIGNVIAVFDREPAPAGVSYPDAVAADAPAAYWRLGESSGTVAVDSSGHANTGTYVNNPLLGVAGALVGDTNTAVRMDGVNDYVRVLDSPTLDVGNTFTVEGWIKRSATTKAHDLMTKGMQVTIMSAANGNQIWLRKPNVSTVAHSNSGVPADGAYHHVVVTKAGSGAGAVKMYIDGVAVGVTDVAPAQIVTKTTTTLSIAGSGSTSADYDELALYPTALGAARVLVHYQLGHGV